MIDATSSHYFVLMSATYATKLSYRDDLGGQLGDPELVEAPTDILTKVTKLSEWVSSDHC